MQPHPELWVHGIHMHRILIALGLWMAVGVLGLRAQEPTPESPVVLPDGRVVFSLLAPGAQSVAVRGLRRSADTPMAKDARGVWSVTVGPLAPDLYSYQFVIDSAAVTDPANRQVKRYFTSESVVEVPGNPPILASAQAVPHGTLHHQEYFSTVRKKDAGVWIYTPPGYDPRASREYPVLYLLHGFGDTEDAWLEIGHANAIFDNLIALRRIRPVIAVMPNGHPLPYTGRKLSKDYAFRNMKALEEDLLGQVIPLVEHDYRAATDPGSRAIAGLSMGGGQALSIGIANPGTFRWVGGFSSSMGDGAELKDTCTALLTEPASMRPRVLWLGVGRKDAFIKRNRAFDAWLTKNGIEHAFELTDGGHEWSVWREFLPRFLESIYQGTAGGASAHGDERSR